MGTTPDVRPPLKRWRLVRRFRPSVGLAVVATLLVGLGAGAGWVASRTVTSPAQTLAEAAPPAHSLLTETVTSGRVSQSVTFDVEIESNLSLEVIAPAPGDGAAPVITRLPVKRGARVRAGDLVAEVSGRPVILLPGALPAYRTLAPGLRGPDVKQLQHALSAAGYFRGSADGVYGPVTAAAVAVLYKHHGYDALTVGTDEVEAAEDAVEQARRALAQVPIGVKSSKERRFAHDDLIKATEHLAAARAESGAQIPVGEVLFVPALPATVADVPVSVGKTPGEALLTLTSGSLVARGTPNAVDAGKVEQGDGVRLLLTPTGEAKGTVAAIEKVAPTEDTDYQGSGLVFTITPFRPIPADSADTSARAIVTTDSSPKEGLVVPEAALSMNAAGSTAVTVVRDGGTEVRVSVIAGFSGDGLVQVEPSRSGALTVGDQVVVGVSR